MAALLVAAPAPVSAAGPADSDEAEAAAPAEKASESSKTSGASENGEDDEPTSMDEWEQRRLEKLRERQRRQSAAAARRQSMKFDWLEGKWTWDLNYELAWSRYGGKNLWLNRFRSGLARLTLPNAWIVGGLFEFNSRGLPALGLQGEFLSLSSGAYLQAGATVDLEGNVTGMLGAGLSVLGGEIQLREVPGRGPTVLGVVKFRMPVSWLIQGVRHLTGPEASSEPL